MNWLGNTNLKPYVFILVSLLFVIGIILFVSRQPLADYFSYGTDMDKNSFDNTDLYSSDASTEDEPTEELTTEAPVEMSYYIMVNKSDNMVSVWNAVNGTVDSIAALFYASVNSGLETGTYYITEKNTWNILNNRIYVQYSSKSSSVALFHSSAYAIQRCGYLITDTYKAIGSSNDNVPGITLTVGDAKWIYENCPDNTVVEVCDKPDMDYGMTADKPMEIPDGIRWDPTDPNKDNKWVTKEIAYVRGITDKVITAGTSIDPWDGVYARTVDNDNITKKLTIINNVDINTPGTYTIEYILADFTGQVIRQYSNVTVTE